MATDPAEKSAAQRLPADGSDDLHEAGERWRSEDVHHAVARHPLRKERFSTLSDLEVPDLLSPADIESNYERDLGFPGQFPYTRGVQPTMYRGRLWTMRMFAGFGTPRQTNERFRYLLDQGGVGMVRPLLSLYCIDHKVDSSRTRFRATDLTRDRPESTRQS